MTITSSQTGGFTSAPFLLRRRSRFVQFAFYVGCPAIQIDDWGNLEAEVKALTADPQRLSDLHRETVAWWRTKLSEPAIGSLIAKCLESPDAIEEPAA